MSIYKMVAFVLIFILLAGGGMLFFLYDDLYAKIFSHQTLYAFVWIGGVFTSIVAYLTSRSNDALHANTLWRHALILMESDGSLAYWLKTCAAAAGKPSQSKLRGLLADQIKIIRDAMEAQRDAGRDDDADRIGNRLLALARYSLTKVPADKLDDYLKVLQGILDPTGLKLDSTE